MLIIGEGIGMEVSDWTPIWWQGTVHTWVARVAPGLCILLGGDTGVFFLHTMPCGVSAFGNRVTADPVQSP